MSKEPLPVGFVCVSVQCHRLLEVQPWLSQRQYALLSKQSGSGMERFDSASSTIAAGVTRTNCGRDLSPADGASPWETSFRVAAFSAKIPAAFLNQLPFLPDQRVPLLSTTLFPRFRGARSFRGHPKASEALAAETVTQQALRRCEEWSSSKQHKRELLIGRKIWELQGPFEC